MERDKRQRGQLQFARDLTRGNTFISLPIRTPSTADGNLMKRIPIAVATAAAATRGNDTQSDDVTTVLYIITIAIDHST